jgi:hypothetical protein
MTEHKLCAQLALPDGYSLLAIVDNEQGALKAALEENARSFRTCEVDVATPEDHVDWVFSPTTEYSEPRYLGVDKLYSVDEVMSEWQRQAETLKISESPSDRGTGNALETVAGIFGKYRDSFNEVAYIRDPNAYAQPWEFHPLHNGEKAFDSKGAQIWPAPAP